MDARNALQRFGSTARNTLRRWVSPPKKFRGTAGDPKLQHDETSNTIRRVMLVLIAYSMFCFFKLNLSDAALATETVKVPFVDVEVTYIEFLVGGPLILLGLVSYLHIIVNHWFKLSGREMNQALPYIFNMRGGIAKTLTGIIFYWLPSIVLIRFFQKSDKYASFLSGESGFGVADFIANGLYFLTLAVTATLLGLQIKRWDMGRRWSVPFVALSLILFLVMLDPFMPTWRRVSPEAVLSAFVDEPKVKVASLTPPQGEAKKTESSPKAVEPEPPSSKPKPPPKDANVDKPATKSKKSALKSKAKAAAPRTQQMVQQKLQTRLNLAKADLSNKDLRGRNFANANMRGAKLNGSNLNKANLTRANLRRANLTGADLRGANLSGADLIEADLSGAKLDGAKFDGAQLDEADLTFTNITQLQLNRACLVVEQSFPPKLPPGRKPPPRCEFLA